MPLTRHLTRAALVSAALLSAGCSSATVARGDEHDEHMAHGAAGTVPATGQPDDATFPAGAATVAARLAASPRHGEWVMIPRAPGSTDSLRLWVVYPERRNKAPVVIVLHEIFGVSTWIRGVADQLAAEGYIAIAPDLITGKYTLAPGDTITQAMASSLIRALVPADVQRDISAAAEYGMSLPSAQQKFGVVGFCWGGSTSFNTAVSAHARLRAAVVYYGGSPATPELAKVRAPVIGFYGENDARVNATIPPADSAMKAMRKSYQPVILAGAGHGFLRQQDGQNGANLSATRAAWPQTLRFFRKRLGR